MPGIEHDVLRLDVSVHDPARMGIGKRVRHLLRDFDGLRNAELLFTSQKRPKRLAASM